VAIVSGATRIPIHTKLPAVIVWCSAAGDLEATPSTVVNSSDLPRLPDYCKLRAEPCMRNA